MTPRLRPHDPMLRVERIGLALGMSFATFLMWPMRRLVTDATYIHLQYARHLAEGRGPVFNVGERVYGCTSPLWTSFLADGIALGGNGLFVARVIGMICTLATVPLFLQLMRRTVRLPELRAFATVAWSVNTWLMMWSVSGMETPLAVALTLAGFVALTEGDQWGSRPIRTGALWALAALTRPEVVFLLLLWALTMLVDANSRAGLRRLVFGLLPPAVIYGAWLLFARFYFGTFWPRSLALRNERDAHFDPGLLIDHLRIVFRTEGVLLLLLAAALVLGGRHVWRRPRDSQHLLPWLWVLSMPLLYVARGIPARSRYLLLLIPVVEWLAWRAADLWWLGDEVDSKPRRNQAMVFAFAVMVLSALLQWSVYELRVLPRVARSGTAMRSGLVAWGDTLARVAPPGSSIASREIGALGFGSSRRMIDLTGLLSPQVESAVAGVADPEARFAFASRERPEFLADRAPRAYDLLRRSPYAAALVPLGHAPADAPSARGDSVYSFYRIDWAAYDSLLAARAHR